MTGDIPARGNSPFDIMVGVLMRWISILALALMTTVTAAAETQTQHDIRTNYDGYGSEQNRYQNAIQMKTHDSILKGGPLEYWNGLDDYYYKKYRGTRTPDSHRGKTRIHHRGPRR